LNGMANNMEKGIVCTISIFLRSSDSELITDGTLENMEFWRNFDATQVQTGELLLFLYSKLAKHVQRFVDALFEQKLKDKRIASPNTIDNVSVILNGLSLLSQRVTCR
jgi:hypothetical protein